MNILVLAPMKQEYINFNKALAGLSHRHRYRVSHTGVGKVNAASVASLELFGNSSAPNYDLVAVIGYAGGSSRLSQGDFVIPRMAKYHDVECPEDLVPELHQEFELEGSDNVMVLTGDSFVTPENVDRVNKKNKLCESVIYDMEAAAVCQVASQGDVPVVVLKLVSDKPANTNNLQSFSEFVETHSNFSQFVHYLESLD